MYYLFLIREFEKNYAVERIKVQEKVLRDNLAFIFLRNLRVKMWRRRHNIWYIFIWYNIFFAYDEYISILNKISPIS